MEAATEEIELISTGYIDCNPKPCPHEEVNYEYGRTQAGDTKAR